ncbi:hypothetical protein BDFB_007702 [Asbolus verrucosus]|uniref:Uncharacterized protein n=1 Tax=Asbolus verrucosus TaxID=1661398 RepID=A0A482V2E0_ASBVE|nr:hypothetical protein BDFB_007702 [Asbolus verrucosus]
MSSGCCVNIYNEDVDGHRAGVSSVSWLHIPFVVGSISWKPLIELQEQRLMNVRNRNKQTMVITMIKCGVVNHAVIAG